ncbi:TM2 domain-containing protein [Sphingosinicella sp.]|uniref:TM2 domain-containing protein n=1 Tax=Sphingosinicella sp. TaxID=1917971 RepID=UPI004037E19F
MASASFGRKGLSADVVGQPARRRAQFGQAGAAPADVASADPVADRRAAFLAAERARAADLDHAGDGEAPTATAGRTKTIIVGGKSLGTAYVLWFFLGGFSAHRFYLGTPLTAIAQVALWYVSLMVFMAGNAGAFYPLTLGWLWILGDIFFIPKLRNAANEKARQRAERIELALTS